MEFFDKYIGYMYGPYFLIFYALVIGLFYFLNKLVHWRYDPTSSSDTLKLKAIPHPYEIAYIRKGPREAIKLILLSLLERGYLIANVSKNSLKKKHNHPPADNLSDLDRRVFNYFNNSREFHGVIDDRELHASIEYALTEEAFLKQHSDMVLSCRATRGFIRLKLLSVMIILVLGAYKCYMAVSTGHSNVFFLIVLGILGVMLIYKISFPWSTKKGEQFIKDLDTIYRPKYVNGQLTASTPYNFLLLASLFGFQLDKGRDYSYLDRKPKGTDFTGSGCGTSCGSVCSSGGSGSCGSSCGGGCGGCGGGD